MPHAQLKPWCSSPYNRPCSAPSHEWQGDPYVVDGVFEVEDAILDGVADVILRVTGSGDLLIQVPFDQFLVLGASPEGEVSSGYGIPIMLSSQVLRPRLGSSSFFSTTPCSP